MSASAGRAWWPRDPGVWVVTACALALTTYRAATASIVHDEALTYQLFIRGSWRRPFAYTGNQEHVLASLLSKLSVTFLPLSEFSLRLPTLLAGALFCAAAYRLLRWVTQDGWLRCAGLALLVFNPFILDYFIEARGYGPLLALMFAAMCLIAPVGDTPVSTGTALGAGVLFGLAIASVQVALYPFAGLVGAYLVCELLSGRFAAGFRRALAMGAASAVVCLPLLARQIRYAHLGDYYIGAETLLAGLGGLIRVSWHHTAPTVASVAELTRVEQVVLAATLAILVATAAKAIAIAVRWASAAPRERMLVWLTATLVLIVLEAVVLHAVLGLKYPGGRTAIYWIPLSTLAAIVMFAGLRPRGLAWTFGCCAIAVVLAKDVVRLQTRSFADVPYDAAGRDIVATLVADRGASRASIRVGGSWQLEPSMNFYRVARGLDWMATFERATPVPGFDYYVLLREDAGALRPLGLRVLFEDPVSGTMLAKPQ